MCKRVLVGIMMVASCLCAGCAASEAVAVESEIASVEEETENAVASMQEETEDVTENKPETEVATEIVDAQEIMDLAHAAYVEQDHVFAEYEYANLSMDENGQPANDYYHKKWVWTVKNK